MHSYFEKWLSYKDIAMLYRTTAKAVSIYIWMYDHSKFPYIDLYIEACNKWLTVEDIIEIQESWYTMSEILRWDWIDGAFEPEQIIFLWKITNEDRPNNPSIL